MKYRYSSPVFIDTVHSLINEFKDDVSNTLCVLGGNHFCEYTNYDTVAAGYDKVVVFNQEPLACSHNKDLSHLYTGWVNVNTKYYDWLRRADEVWDYDENNIDYLKTLGIDAKLHLLKPYMDWSQYAVCDKDIDILFVGNLSIVERRVHILNFLKRRYNVKIIGSTELIYGDQLDEYILRSKILLNIHGISNLQEQARMIKWIGAPCEIISEKSAHNYLGVHEKEYWELFLI